MNEVVFSPSESHCATCSDDGSVRVWSVASMELLIQFQVLSQVYLGGAWGWGARPGLRQPRPPSSLGVCLWPWAWAPSPLPRGVLMFSYRGSPELPLPVLEPPILRTPRAAVGGSGLQ